MKLEKQPKSIVAVYSTTMFLRTNHGAIPQTRQEAVTFKNDDLNYDTTVLLNDYSSCLEIMVNSTGGCHGFIIFINRC